MSIYDEMGRIATALDAVETGKSAVAEAITAKGVDTLPNSSFDTLATNIGLIAGGGGGIGEPFAEYEITLDNDYTTQSTSVIATIAGNQAAFDVANPTIVYIDVRPMFSPAPDGSNSVLLREAVISYYNPNGRNLPATQQYSALWDKGGSTVYGAEQYYGIKFATQINASMQIKARCAAGQIIRAGTWKFSCYKIA